MSMKVRVLLLMLLILQVTAPPYKCHFSDRPANCKNNSRIRVSKTDDTRYQLMLCVNNQCSESRVISFECEFICDACGTVADMVCDGSDRECEGMMDTFFDNYCLSVTSVADPESTPTTTNNSITTTFSSPFSTQAPKPIMNSGACENGSRVSASESDGVNHTTTGPIAALAVLSCLSVLLLTVVTTGWVCTCLIMKKREGNKSSQLKHTSSTDYEEKYLRNPTYGGITSVDGAMIGATTYETVNTSLSSQGMAGNYDMLNRGQAIGQTSERDAQSTTGAEGNYSQLGPRDCEHVNKQ